MPSHINTDVAMLLLLAISSSVMPSARGMPTITFTKGVPLEDLPGASLIAPMHKRSSVTLKMITGRIVGSTDTSTLLNFTGFVYRNSIDGKAHLFGPTVRVEAGEKVGFTLYNALSYPPGTTEPPSMENTFSDPLDTNLHIHGLHVETGVLSQANAETVYGGSDNVFYHLMPRKDGVTQKLEYSSMVPKDHLPGLHWYHPHSHGSSGLQSATANGLIIVEDNPAWLPDANGCKSLRTILAQAPEMILSFGFMLFRAPQPSFPGADALLDDASMQTYSNMSGNPYCCGKKNSNQKYPESLHGTKSTSNLVLVNGGLEPVITMEAGVWYRWRLAHVGYKYFLDAQILNYAGNHASECDMMLVAKDGVYMLQIPRRTDNIFLAPANRAELLVRCTPGNGKGATYTLSSGNTEKAPSPFGNYTSFSLHSQKVLATIKVTPAGPGAGAGIPFLNENSCTPLRPAYAADLRDASLAKYNATKHLVRRDVKFTYELPYGCLVNSKMYSFPDPAPIVHPLGKIVEWPAFENANEHPLHIHTSPFQTAYLTDKKFLQPGTGYGQWFKTGDFYDTLMLPMTTGLFPADAPPEWPRVALRMQPDKYTGYSVMHCHSLQHEDAGCMKVIKWACPGSEGADEQPKECPHETPVPGTFAV